MANTQHKNITEADLHEPKGVSTASVDTVYVADGAGSGAWAQAPYHYIVQDRLTDVSTASSNYAMSPVSGVIDKIYTVIEGVPTVADATVTFYINGVAITNSTITITVSGAAAGDVDSSTPTANNTVVAGDKLTVTSDGASTTAVVMKVFYRIKVG